MSSRWGSDGGAPTCGAGRGRRPGEFHDAVAIGFFGVRRMGGRRGSTSWTSETAVVSKGATIATRRTNTADVIDRNVGSIVDNGFGTGEGFGRAVTIKAAATTRPELGGQLGCRALTVAAGALM